MSKSRLEAFSDGVLAVIITIMVLELRPPEGSDFSDLEPLRSHVLIYVLSFTLIAIYWNNHHHLMQVVEHISGGVMWANAHLLFWLSLVPLATGWLGEHVETAPVVMYGAVQLGAAIAYFILARTLLSIHASESRLATALGNDRKGKLSLVGWALGIAIAFVLPWAAIAMYVAVAIAWLIPDRRVERLTA